MTSIPELERFFELDLKVKKLIESSRPNLYNSNAVDIEKDLLKTIETSKIAINQMLFLSRLDLEEEFNELFDKIVKDVENCNYNIDKLISIYEKDILKMSDGFEEMLEKNIYAHQVQSGQIYIPLNGCKTVNDMLHYVHFYVVNNERIMKSMNLIDSVNVNEYGFDGKRLYGKENKDARNVFDKLPVSEDIVEVSFDNHLIIMVRGRGHALVMDAQKEEDGNYRVSYNIPKVCNIELVNKLKGVKKLDPNIHNKFDPTHGEFVTESDKLGDEISSFILSVPTDDDLKNISDKNVSSRRL